MGSRNPPLVELSMKRRDFTNSIALSTTSTRLILGLSNIATYLIHIKLVPDYLTQYIETSNLSASGSEYHWYTLGWIRAHLSRIVLQFRPEILYNEAAWTIIY